MNAMLKWKSRSLSYSYTTQDLRAADVGAPSADELSISLSLSGVRIG